MKRSQLLPYSLLLTLYNISYPVGAKVEVTTEYRWHSEVVSDTKLKGKCYEIDIETAGQKYLSIVTADKCRPPKEKTTYRWMPRTGAPGGTCYEVDVDTRGEGYSKFTDWRNCIPPQAQRQYVLNEGKCYLVGQFNQSPFIQSVSYNFCKSNKLSYQFVLANSGTRGTCYEVDNITKIVKNTDLIKCRPKGENSTQFIWEPNKGRCYEVAIADGPKQYISSANIKKCKPKIQSYRWRQGTPPQCLAVGEIGNGTPYQHKVSDKFCLKDVATEFHFVKTTAISGICYEVDSETSGTKLRRKVAPSKCKNGVKELNIEIITYNGQDYCIERDKKDPTKGYRKSINKTRCREETNEFRWEQDDKNPFKGNCLKLTHYRGKPLWSRVMKNSCKKGKTAYFWYRPEHYPLDWIKRQRNKDSKNKIFTASLESILATKDNLIFFGKCYEIDEKIGPSIFSKVTNIHNCKPENIQDIEIRYFHPRDYIKGGCYQVDKKTSGDKYLKKILDKECKDIFLKTKNQIEEKRSLQ